jgi:hypothetical protein
LLFQGHVPSLPLPIFRTTAIVPRRATDVNFH